MYEYKKSKFFVISHPNSYAPIEVSLHSMASKHFPEQGQWDVVNDVMF